jgi:septal ring factor EnvC (AmiA/AmiB activator)
VGRLVGLITALLGVCAPIGFAWAASEAEVAALRTAIEETRSRVGGYERAERDLFEVLEQIDKRLERLATEVRVAESDAKKARDRLANAEAQRAHLERMLARTRQAMSARAVALYKTGSVGPIRVLFSSASMQELLSKVWTLEKLLTYDVDLIARYRDEHTALMRVERDAEESTQRLASARAALRERTTKLRAERIVREELLTRARMDRTRERALLVELERAARALDETLSGLGEQAPAVSLASVNFAGMRGRLKAPVPGRMQLGFGRIVDDDYLTETFRNGVEFEAGLGDSVVAVARGQVRFAGWFRGYGKIVILDHGDGYFTVSGHLAEIFVAVGDSVDKGDMLGSVGETGSLSGPGLYFEVRSGGTPLDPAEWLAKG